MPKPSLSRAEQETIIRWDAEATTLDLYTSDPNVARRWEKLGYALDDVGRGWRGTAPAGSLTLKRANRTKRVLSPERIQKLTETLAAARIKRIQTAQHAANSANSVKL